MSLRERKKAETTAAIVAAAGRLFRERGYADTRTRDIAEAAGIATGTLFNYAATKEDVVVLLWQDRASKAVVDGMAAAAKQSDPVAAMVAVFRPILSFYAEDLDLGRVFLQAVMFSPSTSPRMRILSEGFVGQLAVLLAPAAGDAALAAALNVFSAYYAVVTLMLAGRLGSLEEALVLFEQLVAAQRLGWRG